MAKNQRSYTQEFKQQIVDLHNQADKGISELSREYGIPKGTISTWIKNLSPVQVSETETISMKEKPLWVSARLIAALHCTGVAVLQRSTWLAPAASTSLHTSNCGSGLPKGVVMVLDSSGVVGAT